MATVKDVNERLPNNIYRIGLKLPKLTPMTLKMFPEASDNIKKGICPICKKKITHFVDHKSMNEYEISGLCQLCQYKAFD